jgi:c-di-GMP-binding flagellar brake protein YcgR
VSSILIARLLFKGEKMTEHKKGYDGPDRRQFVRLDYVTPLAYKICKKETLSKLLQGYTANISESGLCCTIREKVQKDDFLWISFDRSILTICEDMEKRSFIYQNGIVGKVVRVEPKDSSSFNVGIKFVTREEQNLTHIYPKVYFQKDGQAIEQEEDEEQEEE